MSRMQDRVVAVTGAGKGIGRGIAKVFAAHGARVLIVDLDGANAAETVKAIEAAGGTAAALEADVTRAEDRQRIPAEALDRYGALDVLCSNVGIFPSARIEAMSEDDWDKVQTLNLKSAFLVVQTCLPALKKSKHGRIVLTSSITGPITGYAGWAHYGASKAGMLGFMRSAAIEFAPMGITINAVLPGNIRTEGLTGIGDDYLRTMERAIPMGRLGTPEDIGNAALFLASDEAAYITGQTIVVDGGQTLPESIDAMQ